jgi:hypothetical protein
MVRAAYSDLLCRRSGVKSMSEINMQVFFSQPSFLFFAVISPITPAKSALSV